MVLNSIRIRILTIIFAGLTCLGAGAQPTEVRTTTRTVVLDQTDQVVYKCAAKHLRDARLGSQPTTRSFLLLVEENRTSGKGYLAPGHLIGLSKSSDSMKDLEAATFVQNRGPFVLDRQYRFPGLIVVGDSYVKALRKSGKLEEFESQVFGYERAWLPGYNRDRTEALVYLYTFEIPPNSNIGSGRGFVLYLKLDGGSWRVVDTVGGWIT